MDSDCTNIAHPLTFRPGISQPERRQHAPDPSEVKIDGRTLSDFLKFIEDFSLQVNHYDSDLSIGDWKSFFSDQIPFAIAGIAGTDPEKISDDYAALIRDLQADNDPALIQWIVDFIFNEVIAPWDQWFNALSGGENSLHRFIGKTIRSDLSRQLKEFVQLVNGINRHYELIKPDFGRFSQRQPWGLEVLDLIVENDSFIHAPGGDAGRINALELELEGIFEPFQENLRILTDQASVEEFLSEENLLGQEGSGGHPAHLALMYTFFRLFKSFQENTNQLTRKHLDYFYREILCIRQKDPAPDNVHVIFELQKFVDKKLIEEGVQLKDGKDANKKDVFFSLNEDIVVNKAKIKTLRTLFLQQNDLYRGGPAKVRNLIQGVYTAPLANSLNGLGESFEDDGSRSWATLGERFSKQQLPDKTQPVQHPFGRLGFVLASPVLLLNEGLRNITIRLELAATPGVSRIGELDFSKLDDILGMEFYFITEQTAEAAKKSGLTEAASAWLDQLLAAGVDVNIGEDLIRITSHPGLNAADEKAIIAALEKRKALRVSFSGEKEWLVAPSFISTISSGPYELVLEVELPPEFPAVTFYNSEVLKEELDTTLPLVKIEIDQSVPVYCDSQLYDPDCCLERCMPAGEVQVSLYEYFRGLRVTDSEICVDVCGVKNLVVQNDENVMDVNGTIYPFGTRPDIADFSVIDPLSRPYCINQEFIDDADSIGITATTKSFLEDLLPASGGEYLVGLTEKERDNFLLTLPVAADKPVVESLLNDDTKMYCPKNLEGPNFYIGSREVFLKNWENVWVNMSWKDKPSNFNQHYKAYVVDKSGLTKVYGLDEDGFEINLSVLGDGQWYRENQNAKNIDHDPASAPVDPNPLTGHNNRYLFRSSSPDTACTQINIDPMGNRVYDMTIQVANSDFDNADRFYDISEALNQYAVDSRNGFLRMTLENQDFLHKDYPFVLARQMMAFGRFTGDKKDLIDDAVYEDSFGIPHVFQIDSILDSLEDALIDLSKNLIDAQVTQLLDDIQDSINELIDDISVDIDLSDLIDLTTAIGDLNMAIGNLTLQAGNILLNGDKSELKTVYNEVHATFETFLDVVGITLASVEQKVREKIEGRVNAAIAVIKSSGLSIFGFEEVKKVLIPNEPYTPVIESISIDYKACATESDIHLRHLGLFENTFASREITQEPPLLPVITQEGALFLGIEEIVPGSNLNILFQLAETTADSEADGAKLDWDYLRNNRWIPLRSGFEILEDDTDGLTRSGIVKISVPGDISKKGHTVMPDNLAWLRVGADENAGAVAEAIGIHAQAVKGTFQLLEGNDPGRLSAPLEGGKISKLAVADAAVKKVSQPYESFNGRLPSDHFYKSVSELLRHRGRGITAFDYERIVMDYFSEVFRAKCIQHTLGLSASDYRSDLELAPGHILMAVIADISRLPLNDRYAPQLPVSKLNRIEDYLADKHSPFITVKASNPRYERVHAGIRLVLHRGKDENYFREQLQKELKLFISPWVEGNLDELAFGRIIATSAVLRFIESRDYVDYVLELQLKHEEEKNVRCLEDPLQLCSCEQENGRVTGPEEIHPLTARSILVAGTITVQICPLKCIEQEGDCEKSYPFHNCQKDQNGIIIG